MAHELQAISLALILAATTATAAPYEAAPEAVGHGTGDLSSGMLLALVIVTAGPLGLLYNIGRLLVHYLGRGDDLNIKSAWACLPFNVGIAGVGVWLSLRG